MLKYLRRWLKIPESFEVEDFRRRKRWRSDYELLAASLRRRLDFDSVLDVGCANGFLLSSLLAAGHAVDGVEISEAAREVMPPELLERVEIGDFTSVEGRWDLVCCVEVAEHIRPPRSRELVDTLCGAARRWIYFTAAPPGQAGHGHINCRPHSEWLQMFADRGWRLDPGRTEELRADLDALRRAVWLQGNSFILRPGRPETAAP